MTEGLIEVGAVEALWRYPVKSMQGEEVDATSIGERGILGDRAYALIDRATGHVVSAKHPRKWALVIACRAAFVQPARPDEPLPPITITLPDGHVICSSQPDVDQILSRVFGREVSLVSTAPAAPIRESDRTPIDGDPANPIIREEAMAIGAPGTFFDYASLHILTTATLQRLGILFPAAQFDLRRFRPNIVV